MDGIVRYETIDSYNADMKVETLNPLVSVINFSEIEPIVLPKGRSYDFYTVFLKDVKCGDIKYGRNYYDYQEGTLVFMAPGQTMIIENNGETVQPKGWALLFHPDLLHGTSLGHTIKDYTFFSYAVNEALHISEQERQAVVDCFEKIRTELNYAVDKHSKKLITSNIELLLNYCVRYYDRQFITRVNTNKDILVRFERLLGDYFKSALPQTHGLPTVKYCADKLNLSANYLGDLIKKESGRSAQEHVQFQLIEEAKERIFDGSKTVSEVAYELGFQYPQYFSRLFKKCVGCSPNEYRTAN